MSQDRVTRPDGLQLANLHGMVTVAPEMKAVFERLRRVARSDATVLIRGESGTGKELVAQAIHAESPRGGQPFRAVNCASFTAELLASELFGHVRGAFTGAIRDKPGLFSLADGGSIFLDEVAELSLDLQARLLRVLQERTFVPVGGISPLHVDVRLISATNKGLRKLVEAGQFREDLMYRIRVVLLFLPPLRERTGDVEALAWHFVDEFNEGGLRRVRAFSRDAWDALLAYPWPGNIRELRNNIEQAFAIGEGPIIRLDELSPELQSGTPPVHAELLPPGSGPPPAPIAPRRVTLDDLERERLIAALEAAGGRKGEAAEALGWSRSTMWRKLKKHGLVG